MGHAEIRAPEGPGPHTMQCKMRRQGYDLERIAGRVAEIYGMEAGEILGKGGWRRWVDARSLFCFWAVREVGNSLASLAIRLRMTPAGVAMLCRGGRPSLR